MKNIHTPKYLHKNIQTSCIYTRQNNPDIHQQEKRSKLWYIHTRKRFSTAKWNKQGVHTLTHVNLQTTVLKERRQTQKNAFFIIPHLCISGTNKNNLWRKINQISSCFCCNEAQVGNEHGRLSGDVNVLLMEFG